jgi:hypothetical protein
MSFHPQILLMDTTPILAAPDANGERACRLAKKLKCKVFERRAPHRGQPAVRGAVGEVAVLLMEMGGRWSARDAAVIFPSWSSLEAVLNAIISLPPTTVARPQF